MEGRGSLFYSYSNQFKLLLNYNDMNCITKVLRTGYVLSLLICQTGVQLHGQDHLKIVAPPSPNIASLGKYGETPVNTYTGIPSISVPLYDIKNGDLELPISISYHAGGIRVEEMASSVGLGWSLNAGGIIGRTVNGLADDNGGWQPVPVADQIGTIMYGSDQSAKNQLLLDLYAGIKDGAPDMYYYNFDKYNGKFFFDQNGVSYSVPRKNISISGSAAGWTIIGEDGSTYLFDKVEQVSSSTCNENDQTTITGWYLSSIKSADQKHQITFTYAPNYYSYTTLIGETKYFRLSGSESTGGTCMQSPPLCTGTQSYSSHRLTKIDFQEGYINFTYNNTRCDLIDDKSLDIIEIYTKSNQLIKRYRFNYTYFGNNASCDRFSEQYKRLKLNSILEESSISAAKPPYEFKYNETIDMPSRLSFGQDHWGYYNDKNSNPGLIAAFSRVNSSNQTIYYAGANRKADATFAQVGILQSIKYPTGGETLFTFESNKISGGIAEPDVVEQILPLSAVNYPVASLPVPYYSATTVTVPAAGALVEYHVTGLNTPIWQGCDIVRLIVLKDGVEFLQLSSLSDGVIEQWPAGTYKLQLITDCGVDAIANFDAYVTAQIPVTTTLETNVVGGLRILQIEDKPANGGSSIIKTYNYQQEADASKSSGVVTNIPIYDNDLHINVWVEDPPGFYRYLGDCFYHVRQSASHYPLATTSGGYVGYSHVVEDQGVNGLTHFYYTAYPDGVTPTFPFAPVESFDWRRGFQNASKIFAKNGAQYNLIKQSAQAPTGGTSTTVYAVKVGDRDITIGDPWISGTDVPEFTIYPVMTEPFETGIHYETTYLPTDVTKFNETKIEYTYSSTHLQPIQITTTTSSSDTNLKEQLIVNRKYPFDYTFTGAPSGNDALGIKKLQDLHVVNAVVEEYQVKQELNPTTNAISNARVTGGVVTTFKTDNPYPDQIFRLDMKKPLTTFGTGSSLSSNAFTKNAAYKSAVQFSSYDLSGNLTAQRKDKDIPYCYLWGYEKRYLVAAVSNSTNINSFAYTSFESDEKGGWLYNAASTALDIPVKTGKYYYKVNGTSNNITRALAPGKYKLEYWAKSTTVSISAGGTLTLLRSSTPDINSWVLYEYEVNVTGSPTLTFTGGATSFIDELRIYPVECQMTTYTYDALYGMTSVTDPNCQTTTYQYDDFGRLRLQKDSDSNITRKIEYNYQVR